MREGASYTLLVYGLSGRVFCRPPEPFGKGGWRQKESRAALEGCSRTSSHLDPAGSAYIQGRMLNPSLELGPWLSQTFLFKCQPQAAGCSHVTEVSDSGTGVASL